MSHERLYRYRWVFVLGVAMVGVLYYLYCIEPALHYATNSDWFELGGLFNLYVGGYWYQQFGIELPMPGYYYDSILGIQLTRSSASGISWSAVAITVAVPIAMLAASVAFLWSTFDRKTLPAQRRLGPLPIAAAAVGIGFLMLAVSCMALEYAGYYRVVFEHEYVRHYGNRRVYKEYLDDPVRLFSAAGGYTLLVGIILYFWKRVQAQFWLLERLSFWLLAVGLFVFVVAVVCYAGAVSYYNDTAYRNAAFLSWSVLLCAWINRLVLLFGLQRYLRAASSDEPICLGCGYDLRGSRQSEGCPECGLTIPERIRQTAAHPDTR